MLRNVTNHLIDSKELKHNPELVVVLSCDLDFLRFREARSFALALKNNGILHQQLSGQNYICNLQELAEEISIEKGIFAKIFDV